MFRAPAKFSDWERRVRGGRSNAAAHDTWRDGESPPGRKPPLPGAWKPPEDGWSAPGRRARPDSRIVPPNWFP